MPKKGRWNYSGNIPIFTGTYFTSCRNHSPAGRPIWPPGSPAFPDRPAAGPARNRRCENALVVDEKMRITLHPLTSKEQDFLWEMIYHALCVPEGHKPFPREIIRHPDISKYAENWGNKNDLGVFAADARTDEKTGAAWLRLFTEKNRGYGYVDNKTPELTMAVLPEFRNRGIGAILLTELLRISRGRFNAVSLSVSAGNNAIHLYQRFGFETVGSTENSYTMLLHLK
jgi:ribosomal protein S18 acetylase RimI-like enzyme